MIDLRQGDCLELMKDLPDGSIDMVLTDPPYGTTACKWDVVIPFESMWEQIWRIIKPNGAVVLFGSEPFSTLLRTSNLKNYKYELYWKKSKPTNHMNAKHQPMRYIETISVFYKKKPTFNLNKKQTPIITTSTNKNTVFGASIDNYKRAVEYDSKFDFLEFSGDRNKLHPTQKPVDLLEYLINTYTNENETVLDFTMGSGSTGVACINTNRNFIGVELDENYFNIAKQRIEEIVNT